MWSSGAGRAAVARGAEVVHPRSRRPGGLKCLPRVLGHFDPTQERCSQELRSGSLPRGEGGWLSWSPGRWRPERGGKGEGEAPISSRATATPQRTDTCDRPKAPGREPRDRAAAPGLPAGVRTMRLAGWGMGHGESGRVPGRVHAGPGPGPGPECALERGCEAGAPEGLDCAVRSPKGEKHFPTLETGWKWAKYREPQVAALATARGFLVLDSSMSEGLGRAPRPPLGPETPPLPPPSVLRYPLKQAPYHPLLPGAGSALDCGVGSRQVLPQLSLT